MSGPLPSRYYTAGRRQAGRRQTQHEWHVGSLGQENGEQKRGEPLKIKGSPLVEPRLSAPHLTAHKKTVRGEEKLERTKLRNKYD